MKNEKDPTPLSPGDKDKFRWEELKIRIDTYKYYLTLTLQANAFFYATTGVVLGYYLKEPDKQTANLKFILLLPILIGSVLGSIFIFTSILQKTAARSIKEILEEFRSRELNIEKIPDINLLYLLLLFSGCISFLVSLLLILLPMIGTSVSWDFIGIAGFIWFAGGFGTFLFARKFNKTFETE